jgi:hypothetical protein
VVEGALQFVGPDHPEFEAVWHSLAILGLKHEEVQLPVLRSLQFTEVVVRPQLEKCGFQNCLAVTNEHDVDQHYASF